MTDNCPGSAEGSHENFPRTLGKIPGVSEIVKINLLFIIGIFRTFV